VRLSGATEVGAGIHLTDRPVSKGPFLFHLSIFWGPDFHLLDHNFHLLRQPTIALSRPASFLAAPTGAPAVHADVPGAVSGHDAAAEPATYRGDPKHPFVGSSQGLASFLRNQAVGVGSWQGILGSLRRVRLSHWPRAVKGQHSLGDFAEPNCPLLTDRATQPPFRPR
jgi:hypothetical protein